MEERGEPMLSKRSQVHGLVVGVLLASWLTGCPEKGTLTDSFVAQGPGNVDMLWIIDNSKSMFDARGQLARSFSAFVDALPENSTTQMAITTTQAWPCGDSGLTGSCDDSVGTAGRIRRHEGHIALLDPNDSDDQELFEQLAFVDVHGLGFERPMQAALMAICEAVELPDVESDFVFEDDDLDENFPSDCSETNWEDAGYGDHPYYEACHCLPDEINYQWYQDQEGQVHPDVFPQLKNANMGLLRGDNPLHVVVVTDEGDKTSELDDYGGADCEEMTGDELCDCRLDHYLGLLQSIVPNLFVSVIGPGQGPGADEDIRYNCNPMSSDACPLEFLFDSVTETGGSFSPILEWQADNETCLEADFSPALADLVLHHPAIEWFRLTAVPEVNTIVVTINDRDIPSYESGGSCVEGGITTGGWSYDGDRRGVSIIGDCTAIASDAVKITYESAGPVLVM